MKKRVIQSIKKGWHWDDGRNWLAVDWLEVWDATMGTYLFPRP